MMPARKELLFLLGCALLVPGFVLQELTPFFLSSATVLFGLYGLLSLSAINWRDPLFLCMGSLWLLLLAGGLYSTHTGHWAELLSRQLALLLIPLGFAAHRNTLDARFTFRLNLAILLMISVFALATLIRYFANYRFMNLQLIESKSIPVWDGYSSLFRAGLDPEGKYTGMGISHIYFSLLQAFAIFLGVREYRKEGHTRFMRRLILGLVMLNLLTIHVFLARTGLLGFYCGLFAATVWAAIRMKKFKPLIYGCLGLALFAAISYLALEPVRNKTRNALDDISAIQGKKDINHRSFAMRLEAWRTALSLIAEHPLTGVGPGDADSAMKRKYEERGSSLWPENRIPPHNQYLESMLGSGILALFLLAGVFIACFYLREFRSPPGIALVVCLAVSLFFESILQRQLGVVLFTFSLLWWRAINSSRAEL